jgi:hypothetical protein
MKKNGLLCIFLLLFKMGFSCECYLKDNIIWDYLFESNVVFKGTVLKIDTVDYKKIIHFEVVQDYKNAQSKDLEIISNMGGPDCGIYDINIGDSWLIFGYIINNKIFTNACTNSCKSTDKQYAQKLLDIETLLKSIGKEISVSKDNMVASGQFTKKGTIGLWKIIHDKGKSIEKRYFSENGMLDSSVTERGNSIMKSLVANKAHSTESEFMKNGKLYKQVLEYDSIGSIEIIRVSTTIIYYQNGQIKEKSNFYSYYDPKFFEIKCNTYNYKKYYNTGIIKESGVSNSEGKRIRLVYDKKGQLKKEWK